MKQSKKTPKEIMINNILGEQARPAPALDPQNLTSDAWYYEHRNHIDVIAWVTGRDGSRTSIEIRIPWRRLEASYSRCRPDASVKLRDS